MDLSQAHSKARKAVKKREEEIEEDEVGEINIIPYLDIVTILTIFMITLITSGLILGSLNTTIPESGSSGGGSTTDKPKTDPEDEPIGLVVQITEQEIQVYSRKNRVIPMNDPKRIPRKGRIGDYCLADFECEYQACDAKQLKCLSPSQKTQPIPVYDYRQLNKILYGVANDVWGKRKKPRKKKTYRAWVMANADIPYATLIAVMDTMRCKLPEADEKSEACLLPSESEVIKKAKDPHMKGSRFYDADRKIYNPDTDALFSDIIFGGGFVRG